MQFDTKLRLLEKNVNTVKEIFNQLMNQRLSSEIINIVPHIPQEFSKYLQKIQNAGFESFATNFRHLYEIETSYVIEKSLSGSFVINALVLIPLSQKNNLFQVYTFVPSIIPFSPKMIHGLEITEGYKGYTIAVNEYANQFVTFDSRKLQECKQVASIKICKNLDSTWSTNKVPKSCLGSIYYHLTDKITKNCPTKPIKLEPKVKKLSENQWLLFSPTGTTVEWKCTGDLNSQRDSIFKYGMLELDDNCHANFDIHNMHTAKIVGKTDIEANIEYKPMRHFVQSDYSNPVLNDGNLEI